MKSSLFVFIWLICSIQLFSQRSLSADKQKYASDYLNQTKNDFLKSIEGLSDAQLNYQPDTSTWSIAQIAEHIVIAETGLFSYLQELLKQPVDSVKAAGINFTEEQIIGMLTDRSFKAKAQEDMQPTGKFASIQAAKDSFVAQRGKLIQYVSTNNDDLIYHVFDGPFGTVNLYQFIIFVSAHTKRHTLQIEEVKTLQGYPK